MEDVFVPLSKEGFEKLLEGRNLQQEYDGPDYNQELHDMIVGALGKRKNFSDEQKDHFVHSIFEDLWMASADAETNKVLPKHYKNIKKSLQKAIKGLDEFLSTMDAAVLELGSGRIISFLSIPSDIKKVADYLKRYNQALDSEKPGVRPGKRNYEAEEIVYLIAMSYYEAFGVKPSTGNSIETTGKRKTTPFDRVCDIFQKRHDTEISDHERKKAIKSLPSKPPKYNHPTQSEIMEMLTHSSSKK